MQADDLFCAPVRGRPDGAAVLVEVIAQERLDGLPLRRVRALVLNGSKTLRVVLLHTAMGLAISLRRRC